MLRKILKKILGNLSQYTVWKHGAEIIVITGWSGTSIVREMLYHVLEDKHNVRRNTTEVWWDLSVPLVILGYEDKKRSIFGWIILIIRTVIRLVVKPRYPHKIIINLDTSVKDIASFWSDCLHPNMMVILKQHPSSKFIKTFSKQEGCEKMIVVYNPSYFVLPKDCPREFSFSEKGKDLEYKKRRNIVEFSYKNQKIRIKLAKRLLFTWEYLPAVVSVGLLQGLSLKKVASRLDDIPLHPSMIKKGLSHLKEFVHTDEKKR